MSKHGVIGVITETMTNNTYQPDGSRGNTFYIQAISNTVSLVPKNMYPGVTYTIIVKQGAAELTGGVNIAACSFIGAGPPFFPIDVGNTNPAVIVQITAIDATTSILAGANYAI